MIELLEKIWQKNIFDALNIEKNDIQYKALENLYKNIKDKTIFLQLIIANSLVCYQLSWTWENYWQEFSEYFSNKDIKNTITDEVDIFIRNSKNNKRLVDIKSKRLQKSNIFIQDYQSRHKLFLENPLIFAQDLKDTMNQKITDKTIVFTIKMWNYWCSISEKKVFILPFELIIPIDSRLTNLYEKYNSDKSLKIKEFYHNLREKLSIPRLHLDAILWVEYEKYMK